MADGEKVRLCCDESAASIGNRCTVDARIDGDLPQLHCKKNTFLANATTVKFGRL